MPDLIEAAITQIARIAGTTVDTTAQAWRVLLPGRDGLQLQLDVPHSVLEWYATIYDEEGNERWRDWMDYYQHGSVARDALPATMAEDLTWFAETVASANSLRLVDRRVYWFWHRRHLEWQLNGDWHRARLFKSILARAIRPNQRL